MAADRIIKVLPLLLDMNGLHTKSPSLYDRDAYQLHLRRNPELQSGMMFAMQLKVDSASTKTIRVRLELRGVAKGNFPRQMVIDSFLASEGGRSRWVYLTLKAGEREYLGDVTAWRASLWQEGSEDAGSTGSVLLADQKSFLW